MKRTVRMAGALLAETAKSEKMMSSQVRYCDEFVLTDPDIPDQRSLK